MVFSSRSEMRHGQSSSRGNQRQSQEGEGGIQSKQTQMQSDGGTQNMKLTVIDFADHLDDSRSINNEQSSEPEQSPPEQSESQQPDAEEQFMGKTFCQWATLDMSGKAALLQQCTKDQTPKA